MGRAAASGSNAGSHASGTFYEAVTFKTCRLCHFDIKERFLVACAPRNDIFKGHFERM